MLTKAKQPACQVHIRWLISRDMPEVVVIEKQSLDAFTKEDLLRCLRQRNCIGMVAEHGEKVVGFMIYELHKTTLHIMNFAVHPQWRRLGVGKQMMLKLISKLSAQRRNKMTALMSETETSAHLFLYQQGFRAIKVMRNYLDSGEDAYKFVYRLGE